MADYYGTGGLLGMPVPDEAIPGPNANTYPLYTWLRGLLPAAFDQGGGGVLPNSARKGNQLPLPASFADRFGNLPPSTDLTAQAAPDALPPTATPTQAGPPMQLGGYDLGTLGPGAPTSSQQGPPSAQPSGGLQPRDFGLLPGLFGHLQAGFSNFTSGGNPLAGLVNMLGGFATGMRTDQAGITRQAQMALYQRLRADGVPEGQAIGMMQNPAMLQSYFDFKNQGEVKNAVGESQPLLSRGNQVGLASGQPVSDFVGGGFDKLQQKAAAEELGKAQGTARAGLPNTQALGDQAIQDVDKLINDPNLKLATGMYGELNKHIPGSPAQGIMGQLKQLHGQAALEGLAYLQKIGRLNINEFNAGANAISRLNIEADGTTKMNYKDVVGALQDLRKVYAAARSRAGVTAGVGPTPSPYEKQGPVDLGNGWSVQQR